MINNCLKYKNKLTIKYVWQYLFKQSCILCAASKTSSLGICSACEADLPYQSKNCCAQCALPANNLICGQCLSNPPYFDKTYALFDYVFPIDTVIHGFKYNKQLQTSRMLGNLLKQKILSNEVDLILPMPMHSQRLKERGFNQALAIAKYLSTSKIANYKDVMRTKNATPQASLPLKERANNVRNVFQANIDCTGLRIAIVDDVMTTGASLNELAKTLKKAGASHVECWIIARTLPHQ